MKKKIFAVIALAMACLMILAGCGGTKMIMGTGGETGTYYAVGGVIGQVVSDKTNLSITAVSTNGSKENILNIKAGANQLGFVQNDVAAYAYNGKNLFEKEGKVDNFRIVAALYSEQVQIVTCDPSIKTVADLKGKKVSIGAAGSGVYFNAIDVLAAYGYTEDDIVPQYLAFGDSADGLKDKQIDAAFIVAGAPTTAIADLANSTETYLVAIDDEHRKILMDNCPYYAAATIPADTYKGITEDVETVTVKATLIVDSKASEKDVYDLTKNIFDNLDTISDRHSKGKEFSTDYGTSILDIPYHAGAIKYFTEKGYTFDADGFSK